ncbi:hypothetical protein K432DRAFT_435162 [Lepidopterella palustris CBS 459.81]|uniref:tRNA(Phe) 7-[(3-amino-3-carboxypropyl)-4-demethylwyosine(37)-N(4)]-methyltransferase n=1 Tax=Lepidopterella palustris CBS 459.81 TaxID=1314670 RepID=A0A8E2JEK1_9PEZI|nr:hypothetical protein K432DRAFT_435162 [Lepidopterella palustris CBS 459.81]
MPPQFKAKKEKILQQLNVPTEEYNDLSPKGSIDAAIRTLVDEINHLDGLVTTSSCAGRISVFLEGRKRYSSAPDNLEENQPARAGPRGKGGGVWLYCSHSPVEVPKKSSAFHFLSLFGMITPSGLEDINHTEGRRYIHLKFEAMILHVLTASLDHAQKVLSAALGAGFRESGAVSLSSCGPAETHHPMVAVRSAGLSFDAIIGYQNPDDSCISMVDEGYLRTLVGLANERFNINTERVQRFRTALLGLSNSVPVEPAQAADQACARSPSDSYEIRRQRKRMEGLDRRQAMRTENPTSRGSEASNTFLDVSIDGIFE